eukprot:CAMPEP_0115298452 /NCGR_PEP_ID=MMETSP0270-20121206/68267_1 /TAXON_ID=71861 /ORGANISM="Scrippsiella trochoidea, Strain CCMP3099" /LENGTH=359 /DNA_ID=CAMNT_0002716133 /DNA_START=37 /DNA_END=1117 /DNA_ORIENTATION=-
MVRCRAAPLLAVAASLGGATAFSVGVPAGAPWAAEVPRTAPRAAAAALEHSTPQGAQSAETSRAQGIATFAGALSTLALLRAAARRRAGARRREASVTRLADGDIEIGYRNEETGETNYVNPWEERVDGDMELVKQGVKQRPMGNIYHEYTGPVYKQVPVVEGLSFPLDPRKYREPLEPPPPGAKWGDGRSPDGNWYMEVDGEDPVQYWQGVGRRKAACAVVRLFKGTGQFIVNSKDAREFFEHYPYRWMKAIEPMAALSVKNDYDCIVKTFGGGKSGQAGAIRLGVARALQEIDYNWRPLMKKAKYLTRDWRMIEPKKTGQHKARKKKPYHKAERPRPTSSRAPPAKEVAHEKMCGAR